MKLNKILGIEYPFIQGAMANIATGEFAAAASNAGGLGIIAGGGMSVEMLKENIQKARALTTKPFGVNVMLMHPDVDAIAQLVADEKVPVITTGAGNPSKYMDMWKAAGSFIMPVVPSVALARRMEKYGADAVIAEGTESGGHVGELTTMALLPQVVAAVNIPVIAAGGVASGGQLLAVHAMGAVGVQLGTCLLVAVECPVHDNYKQAIIKAGDTDTIVTGRSAGAPVRALKNKMSREYAKLERQGVDKMEIEHLTLGSLKRAVFDGDVQMGSVMAGQVAGQITEIRPIKVIFEDLYTSYKKRLAQLSAE